MQYIQLMGRCEDVDDTSYERAVRVGGKETGKQETVQKWQLTLAVPSMRERLLCEVGVEQAPKLEQLERWELEETWLVVGANSMRALGFERTNPRPGEKATGAMVIFQAAEVREATEAERKQLQASRKQQKQQAKARRAERATERKAQRAAAEPVAQGAASARQSA